MSIKSVLRSFVRLLGVFTGKKRPIVIKIGTGVVTGEVVLKIDAPSDAEFNQLLSTALKLEKSYPGTKKAFSAGEFTLFTFIGDISTFTKGNVIGGKVRTLHGNVMTLEEYEKALAVLGDILEDTQLQIKLMNKAYDETLRPVLKRRLGNRSLSRGGLDHPPFARSRSQTEFHSKWQELYEIISGPLKTEVRGNTIFYFPFTMKDLLAINMSSSQSRMTNVFMMVEFGTGISAAPRIRRFRSIGSTRYKINPRLASQIIRFAGASGDTAQWVSRLRQLNRLEASGDTIDRLTRKGNLTAEETQQLDKSTRHFATAVAAHVMGGEGPKSIKPRKIIFDSRGVIPEVQQAYKNFLARYIRLLNELLFEKVLFWPLDGLKISNPEGEIFGFDVFKQLLNEA
jgi:hypothetical protein